MSELDNIVDIHSRHHARGVGGLRAFCTFEPAGVARLLNRLAGAVRCAESWSSFNLRKENGGSSRGMTPYFHGKLRDPAPGGW